MAATKKTALPGAASIRAAQVLKMLERGGSAKFRAELEPRYGITAKKAFGTPMAKIKAIAKPLGKDHALAQALWATGVYEARLLASIVGEPEKVTAAQMERWAKDFDNWGVCDTVCFNLFDRTPHAFAKIDAWVTKKAEHHKRASFALLATMALHRRTEDDAEYLRRLPLIEAHACDGRNFVKKGVSWALRAIGLKRAKLRAECVALAKRLAASDDPSERWVGKDAMREFAKAKRA